MQCISDLHLEFYKKIESVPKIPVNAPILVLAGDIGYPTLPLYWEFLTNVSRDFEHVILVPGNHEYYHSNTQIYKKRILSISKMDELIQGQLHHLGLTNVHFLQKSEIVLNNIRFVGATLWSHIPQEHATEVATSMADFRRSFSDAGTLQISDVNTLHADHVAYLKHALHTETNLKTVVITHHMPSFRLVAPQFEGSHINCAFASSVLEDLSQKPDFWICGHSHCRTDVTLDGTRVIMNAVGYPDELPLDKRLFRRIEV
jgi:hypothetical protein